MTGADIIGALLLADADLLAFIPDDRIKEDRLPDGVTLPALVARTISSIDRQTLKRLGVVRVTDRVSVTVRADSVRNRKTAIRLVRKCCAGRVGNIGGGQGVAILPAGVGPSVIGAASSFEQAIDFRVSFNDAV